MGWAQDEGIDKLFNVCCRLPAILMFARSVRLCSPTTPPTPSLRMGHGAGVSAAERLVTSDLCPSAPAGVPDQGFGGPGVAQGGLAVGLAALLTMALMLACAR